MAETKQNRVKAAKLRAKIQAGKKLKPDEQRFYDDYTKRTAMSKARVQKFKGAGAKLEFHDFVKNPSGARTVIEGVTVRQPPPRQLPPPTNVPVHETEHLTDRLDAAALTWRPVVLPPPEDAEPQAPGAPPPPAPGAPIVDAVPDPETSAGNATEGTGSPTMAVKVAGIVLLITKAGVAAAAELLQDAPMPDFVAEALHDPEAQQEVAKEAAAAAYRMSINRGWQDIPGSDEVTVVTAVLGSFGAIFLNHKRKKKLKAENGTPAATPSSTRTAASAPAARPNAPEAPLPPELAGIWEDAS
jgi:hypothetical protein